MIAGSDGVVKVSVRDLATIAARGGTGATTVASTAHLAALAGIAVFATGGLGGVHRQARESWDESADLGTLSRTPITVVCAGVKSILDVAATLERLETLNVGVLGYRTDAFPGFYLADSGHRLDWRVDSAAEVAAVMRARAELGTDRFGLIVANPIPAADELDRQLHDRTLAAGLAALSRERITGKQVTPFLLDFFHRETRGASLTANVALVLNNARVAAEIAAAYAASSPVSLPAAPPGDPAVAAGRAGGLRGRRHARHFRGCCPDRWRTARTPRRRSASRTAARRPTPPPGWPPGRAVRVRRPGRRGLRSAATPSPRCARTASSRGSSTDPDSADRRLPGAGRPGRRAHHDPVRGRQRHPRRSRPGRRTCSPPRITCTCPATHC